MLKHLYEIPLMICFLLLVDVLSLSSQEKHVISRISEPIQLDGLVNERIWDTIEPLPMTMHTPNYGDSPTERTEVFMAYDNNYLYCAGRLYMKDPSNIQALSKKRDLFAGTSNWFGLILDTFNDKENAVAFFTTPAGVRIDLSVFGDAQTSVPNSMPVNTSWNTFWDVKTSQSEEGWFAEMRIPFSSLRFQEINGKITMGLIVWRWISPKNEQIIFPSIPQKWGMLSSWKPSQAQEIVLEGIPSKNPFYITPYALSGLGYSFDLNDEETEYLKDNDRKLDIGLDVKYGLTNNLTLDVTVNTDFAQVEADDQQINLTRFSLFFPEKRLFFQERSSNFEFNLGGPSQLFYSRKIGIHEGTPVQIYGGARVVGRMGPWDVGLLNMQTAPIDELASENFGVFRLRRQVVNPNSYVGGIVTTRVGTEETYNMAYGVDGIFRVHGDDYLKAHWAQTFEDTLENNLVSLNNSRISINWERRTQEGFAYNWSFSRVGDVFNPGIGFIFRDNYTRFGNQVLFGWIPENSFLTRHNVYFNGNAYLNNDDRTIESAELGPGWEYNGKAGYFGNVSIKMLHEDVSDSFSISDKVDVPDGEYTFYNFSGFFHSPMGYFINTMVMIDAGSFYDGWRFSLGLTPTWSISSDFELSGFYQYNRVSFSNRFQDLTAHIGRLRLLWMLSISVSFSAYVQYNSADDAVITNVRFRYNPREGNDLYLVYDEGYNTDRFREIPFRPHSNNRTILLKYSYTFNRN